MNFMYSQLLSWLFPAKLHAIENEPRITSDVPLDASTYKKISGSIKSGLNKVTGELKKYSANVKDYLSRGNFHVSDLPYRVGGYYEVGEGKTTLNHRHIEKPFGEESIIHELYHKAHDALGGIREYAKSLYENFGRYAPILLGAMTEGIASYFTKKTLGRNSAYPVETAGIEQVAKEYGEETLLKPKAYQIPGMVGSFLRGCGDYVSRMYPNTPFL